MLARLVRELPEGPYVYEPKWDGFRCIAAKEGGVVTLTSRHDRPLGRYFPEIVRALGDLETDAWTIDGEVLVVLEGGLGSEALMMRLRPAACRVEELARQPPAFYVAFDAIAVGDADLSSAPF